MDRLITASKVIDIAFTRKVDAERITDTLIETAQHKYLKPVLGDDLYDAYKAAPTASQYTDLAALIEPMLAYWVKYLVLPELYVDISSTGIRHIETQNTTQVSSQRLIELREQCRVIAEDKQKQVTEYLNDPDTTLSDYSRGSNTDHVISMAGGIIHRKRNVTAEDDSPEKWT